MHDFLKGGLTVMHGHGEGEGTRGSTEAFAMNLLLSTLAMLGCLNICS